MNIFHKIQNKFLQKPEETKDNLYNELYLNFTKNNNESLSDNRNYQSFANNGYIKNPIAFRAINIIAHTTSSITLIPMKCRNCKNYNATNSDLLSLIKKPNPFSSQIDFIETIVYHLMISGNAYILKIHDLTGSIKELYVLKPEQVELITNNLNDTVVAYQYSEGNKLKKYKIHPITGECDILHLKNFHPTNNIYGLSPLEAAANAIDQQNAATMWNKSLLENGARPSGALIVRDDKNGGYLSSEQRNQIKKQLKSLYSGPMNSGKPLLLEANLEWKELSISPKELDFTSSDRITIRQIANALGVPIQMLNDSDSSSYNNYLEGKRALYENTVLPLLNKIITSVFNNWICPLFGKDYFVTYKEEDIPALSYKKEQLLANLKNSDFLTINEKRALFGMDPINEGDKM